jgi:hypothetical protein
VADSNPSLEYQETLNKARAVLSAIAEAERMEASPGPAGSPDQPAPALEVAA